MLDGAHDRHALDEPLRPDRRREVLRAGPTASLAGRDPLPDLRVEGDLAPIQLLQWCEVHPKVKKL